jgi:CYTH domain-containing protein
MDDRPTKRAYARIERERRFLLDRLPPALDPEVYERLDDLFVEGTHLRLRRVCRPDGASIVTKLGQKIVDPEAPEDPRRRQMTTIYLPDEEALALASLTGLRTTKRRYKLLEQGRTFCVDVWESPPPARGTIVAEVEAESMEELEWITVPTWALREVTDDGRYSAITLAALLDGGGPR